MVHVLGAAVTLLLLSFSFVPLRFLLRSSGIALLSPSVRRQCRQRLRLEYTPFATSLLSLLKGQNSSTLRQRSGRINAPGILLVGKANFDAARG